MGSQTAVMILNDAMDGLKTDPNVGEKMYRAILESSRPEYRNKGLDFSIGNHCNGGMVLPSQHADQVQIVAVGGNYMIPLGTLWGRWTNMQEPDKLLKDLATQMGYRLVKMPTK